MDTRPPGRPPKTGERLGVRIEIRATDDERDRIDEAASITGMERSDWIRNTLKSAANQTILEHGETQKLKRSKKQGKKEGSREPPDAVNEPH